MPQGISLVAVVVLVAGSSADAAPPSFSGTLDVEVTAHRGGDAPTVTVAQKVYVSPAGTRLETEEARGRSLERTIILQLASAPREMYVLNSTNKTYRVLSVPQKVSSDQTTGFRVERLGDEKIAGYSCKHARLSGRNGDAFEVWVANELDRGDLAPSPRPGARDWSSAFQALREAGMTGFPLKFARTKSRSGTTSWVVTKVDTRPVPAGLFEMTGYKRVGG